MEVEVEVAAAPQAKPRRLEKDVSPATRDTKWKDFLFSATPLRSGTDVLFQPARLGDAQLQSSVVSKSARLPLLGSGWLTPG